MAKTARKKTNKAKVKADTPFPATGAFALPYKTELSGRTATLPRVGNLTPLRLAYLVRSYVEGRFGDALPTIETIVLADAHLAMCIEKRIGQTVYNDYEFLYEDGLNKSEKKRAQKQIAALRDLFNTIRVSNVKARDEELGVQGLIRHLLGAIGYGYAVAAMEFYPATAMDGSITDHVQFLTCPLSFFEAKERKLKIRKEYFNSEGVDLNRAEWLIAHYPSSPLLIPSLEVYAEKNSTIQDWVHTVEKFGTPFVYANTQAAKGSDDWRSAEHAVSNLGAGFAGVFGSDVQITTASLAQGNAPHEKLIDYLDRLLARLWLGNDLSSMSRAQDSIGSYAQAGELDALTESDRIFIEQTLDLQIVKPFLARVFGDDERQLVYFKFKRKEEAKDMSAVISRIQQAVQLNLPMPTSFIYGLLEIPEPKDGEEVFYPQGTANPQEPQQLQRGQQLSGRRQAEPEQESEETETETETEETETTEKTEETETTANSALDEDLTPDEKSQLRKLQDISNEQFAPLKEALEDATNAQSDEEFKNKLRGILDRFPDYKRDILSRNDLADAMSEMFLAEWQT